MTRWPRAVLGWGSLLDGIERGKLSGIAHYGVVVETTALVQRGLGMAAAGDLHWGLLPALSVLWIIVIAPAAYS